MYALVTGLIRIPSDVTTTAAFVPFSIAISLRMRIGITTWPFVPNVTVLISRTVVIVKYHTGKEKYVKMQREGCDIGTSPEGGNFPGGGKNALLDAGTIGCDPPPAEPAAL